ncbi:adenylate cyclase [Kingella kingae ATCC 23330]|uniref:Adenylate cyclase n=1 Tax=Kingella kingae ATCC 23330 TaxID=887327 RepID=F5S968_KINKI|nr:adenylate cyclase [Kingella kingae ATCC 23330]
MKSIAIYIVEHEGFVFEVDEFFGDNAPLIVAELELPSEDTAYAQPDWLGEEITSDGRFTNAYLSKHPFGSWS